MNFFSAVRRLTLVSLLPAILFLFSGSSHSIGSTMPSQNPRCLPGQGWRWGYGELSPDIIEMIKNSLTEMGISAETTIQGSGEKDSCGTFFVKGIDISILPLDPSHQNETYFWEQVSGTLQTILQNAGAPPLERFAVRDRQGRVIWVDNPNGHNLEGPPTLTSGHPDNQQSGAFNMFLPSIKVSPPQTIIRKVLVIVYDPLLKNGQLLSDYLNWNEHEDITQQTADFFYLSSETQLQFTIVDTIIVTDGWPAKIDGFVYTEAEYLDVMSGDSPPHSPDIVDYNLIVNDPQFDICDRANSGEVDEVWIYNGPYFGFWESTLVGPGAYYYNSPPVSGPHNCNRLTAIMGPSPERAVASAVHNFGHRTESTMTKVYGSWQQNSTNHNWERFALVAHLSPDYWYSGCGNIHYPANGTMDYDYDNLTIVPGNCPDFANYPALGNPDTTAVPTSCTDWSCDEMAYYHYWFSHLPANSGCGPDTYANSWWYYVADPALAINPSAAC